MCKINLQAAGKGAVTVVSNVFIDRFMKDANGTYVKVYLYLLRCLADPSVELSLSLLADRLEETEGDVTRALRYWEKVHVLSLSKNEAGEICDIALVSLNQSKEDTQTACSVAVKNEKQQEAAVQKSQPASVEKPNYCAAQLEQFKAYGEFNQVLDHIEQLVGKPLSMKELQTPAFLFESLGFSGELICFIFDYCFEKDKKSFTYIEKVARDWYERGIRTVADAEGGAVIHTAEFAAVRTAFGLSRAFGASERKHILHWCNDLGFSEELIGEACNRTLMNTSKTDFKYADKILQSWYDEGVKTLAEAMAKDAERKKTTGRTRKQSTTVDIVIPNKFNNYDQRKYSKEQLEELEMRLLKRS